MFTEDYSNLPKRKIRSLDDVSEFVIKGKNNKIVVKSSFGYTTKDKVLAILTDTGNEFIIDFPSWGYSENSTVSIDYAEAHYMYHILKYIVDNNRLCAEEEIKDKPRKSKV